MMGDERLMGDKMRLSRVMFLHRGSGYADI
jgi:hypothetical protein